MYLFCVLSLEPRTGPDGVCWPTAGSVYEMTYSYFRVDISLSAVFRGCTIGRNRF